MAFVLVTKVRRRLLFGWSKFTHRIPAQSIGYLFRFVPKYFMRLVSAMICMAIAGGFGSLIAVLVGKLTDEGFLNHTQNIIWLAPFLLLSVTAANGFFGYCGSCLLQNFSQSVLNEVRMQMFHKLIYMESSEYQKITPGQIHTAFLNQADNAMARLAGILTTTVQDTLSIISLVAVLFWHDWQLSLITLLIVPIIVFLIRVINRKTKEIALKSQNVLSNLSDALSENYLNAKVVKIYSIQNRQIASFEKENKRFRRLGLKSQIVSAASTPLTQITMMVAAAIVVVVALIEANAGQITIGQFVTYLTALLLLSPPLRHLSGLSISIAKFTAAADSLYELIRQSEEKLNRGILLEKPLMGRVEFRNVSFSYVNVPTLKEISFKAEPGQTVALVGPSGAGKTTVLSLLAGFSHSQSGEILFDGINQKELSIKSLRKNISMVSQEVGLFDGTLAENVAYGNSKASREEIFQSLKLAYLEELIESTDKGIDLPIGPQGGRISGGQRQRVAIARALIKKAPILLLDEATSALDSQSEKYIEQSLDHLMRRCTTFVVAHRLSTIVNADQIYVFSNGQIVESGTHKELLAKNGTYAMLYRSSEKKQRVV